jgi:hypothetical protein
MRLGSIQKDIVVYLSRCGVNGGYIGIGCKAEEFRGYDWEQVEAALERLLHRRLIRREGIRYILVSKK